MLIRASIVVLVILNLGVATWWATRSETPASPTPERATEVATLELLPPAAAVEAVAAPPMPAAVPPEAAQVVAAPSLAQEAAAPAQVPVPAVEIKPEPRPERCLSLGLFAERSQAEAALARLAGLVARPRLREVVTTQASSYRVWIPPAASRDAAQAIAKRIVDAGLSDYYVIAQGDDANAVALGQYRNREGAERRLATLKAAGFASAVISGGADAASAWWIDTAVLPASSDSVIAQRSGAARQQSLDCARLR